MEFLSGLEKVFFYFLISGEMSKGTATLKNFFIFNPTYGPKEGEVFLFDCFI